MAILTLDCENQTYKGCETFPSDLLSEMLDAAWLKILGFPFLKVRSKQKHITKQLTNKKLIHIYRHADTPSAMPPFS